MVVPEGQDAASGFDANWFKESLSRARKLLGNALSLSQTSMLDAPWIFDSETTQRHTNLVLDNNRRLALAVDGVTGIFSHTNHPCLGPQSSLSWAESPIVIMDFNAEEDNTENARFLQAVIAHEARNRNLVLCSGSSFGFRHHRCELVRPHMPPYTYADGRPRHFLKLAMGSRSGPSLEATIQLMRELAAFEDFHALRLAYPQINTKHEMARFPDLQLLRQIR